MTTKHRSLPKITRTASGKWTARIFEGYDANGKRIYTAYTHDDYNTLVSILANTRNAKESGLNRATDARESVVAFCWRYLEVKKGVLSPTTLYTYESIIKNADPDFLAMPFYRVTSADVQQAVTNYAVNHSAKSTFNMHGFLSAVFTMFRPDFTLHTRLPQRQRPTIRIPTENELKSLLGASEGTDMELPIILGACCGLRKSEILALTPKDIDLEHGTLSVRKALVYTGDGAVEKLPKTRAGTRVIRLFPFALEKLKNAPLDGERLVKVHPSKMSPKFQALCRKCGVTGIRFHDLRHYCVSVMLSLNIPKNYIASYVGHENDKMIDRVYGHIMASKKTEVEDALNTYFSSVFQMNTNGEK